MGSARPFMAAIGISLFIAAGFPARPTTAQQATASTAETLARLSATIAGQYPSARALVLARGNCILHEYYAFNSPEGQWPVHSVTKSVLSILVGIAIDKGLLRLDQKLPELVAEASEGTIDPRAADITLRDLLTMSSGFDPGTATVSSSVWMIRRTVKYTPGTHFYYDDEGTNLIAIILRRAVGGNIAEFAKNELFARLQIDRYFWAVDRDGNLPGFSGLLLTGRDMAKIGLLYLQRTVAGAPGSIGGLRPRFHAQAHRRRGAGPRRLRIPVVDKADTRRGNGVFCCRLRQPAHFEPSGPQPRDGAGIRLLPSRRGREIYQRGCVARRSGAAGGSSVCRAPESVTGGATELRVQCTQSSVALQEAEVTMRVKCAVTVTKPLSSACRCPSTPRSSTPRSLSAAW
jgi:CubicO group peptidase (beta-lactamase class C family)